MSSHLLNQALSLDDFERLAKRKLPRPLYGYIQGATETRQSYEQNRAAFKEIDFLPHTLRDVRDVEIKTSLFDHSFAAPFGIAPMGLAALSHFDGDILLAKAAGAANIPMVLSGASLTAMEKLVTVNPDIWFQAYLPNDEARCDALLERVAKAGIRHLVITVDLAANPNPENAIRSGFSMPFKVTPRLILDVLTRPDWLCRTWLRTWRYQGVPHFENAHAGRGRSILDADAGKDFGDGSNPDWPRFAHIRKKWQGNLIIKGMLHPEDVARAQREGADGVVISNHGGRQLDGAIAPLRILPEIVEACAGMTLIIDSGFRRGSDVLKAMAMGADFVLLGRPFNFASALAGKEGVTWAIDLLATEIKRNLGFLGLQSLAELEPGLLRKRYNQAW